uniref:C-type lectin domain-containing protein n=1 Tax=Panagrolaimus superbus TaxID=310955 RepID=A0A914YMA8_9BILA
MRSIQVIFFFFHFITLIFGLCPNESIEWQNACYSFHSESTSFTNAEIACNNFSGHLTSIHNGFVNSLLAGQAANHHLNKSTVVDFWIGLNSLMIPGNWSWMDNSTYDFKNWASSEPKNLSMSCAAEIFQSGDWSSDDCLKLKPYVCEIPQILTTTTEKYPRYMNCSPGWIYFEKTHSCFGDIGIGRHMLNWTEGEEWCIKSNGGHLPTFHSYEEAKFISFFADVYGQDFWVGLYSLDNEVSWKWSDDSSFNYRPWANGYPKRNISSCVALWDKQIRDYDCQTRFNTICKRSADATF